MSNVVKASEIEEIVGRVRHQTYHFGRWHEEAFYILHSGLCRAFNDDLRNCEYSIALDYGWIDAYDGGPVPKDNLLTLSLYRNGILCHTGDLTNG